MQFALSILEPRTYFSPSREYTLIVDPQNPRGIGSAQYHLSHKGKTVWEGIRPFTLWEADVSDTGVVGGYAYSNGWEGWPTQKSGDTSDYGDFEVVILDPRGRERLHQKVKRVVSGFLHQAPQPIAWGVLVDGAHDRLIVRVADPDINRGVEEWWVFQLSTGRQMRRLAPKAGMGSPEAVRFVIDARCVPGTPLVLLHWWSFDLKTENLGGRFTLLDPGQGSAKPVWVLDLPRDYNIPGNEKAQDRLMDEISKDSAILETTASRQFTLRFVREQRRVTFRVSAEPGRGWRVIRFRSTPYIPPTPKPEPKIAEVRPKLQGRLDLLAENAAKFPSPRPIQRPDCLTSAGPGHLAFVSLEGVPALVMVAQTGEVLHRVALDRIRKPGSAGEPQSLKLVWQGERRFVLFCERSPGDPENSYTEAYRVDAQKGEVSPLEQFRCPPLGAVAAFPDGGFVVLATVHAKYTAKEEIYAYDGMGKRTWALTSDFGSKPDDGPEVLFSPESLAVLRNGTVAVLDVIRHTVQFYDRGGKYLRTLSLDKAWKREASYPSDIIADSEGGFLVHDFSGTPAMVWMKEDGSVVRSFTPRYDNQKPIENPDFCIATDGRLWLADGYSLLGLDSMGHVTTRLGETPSANRLTAIASIAVLPEGRILIVDERTSAVHVLNIQGQLLHVCVAPSGVTEAAGIIDTPAIDLGPANTFAIEGNWFGADGKPRTKPQGFRTARERLSLLRRRANRSWLGQVQGCATAPSGALAAVDTPLMSRNGEPGFLSRFFLSLYSAMNVPERTIELPSSLGSVSGVTYDGRYVVVTGGEWGYCYRTDGRPLWRFVLPLAPGERRDELIWHPFLIDGGRTLCLFNGVRTLYRYVMP